MVVNRSKIMGARGGGGGRGGARSGGGGSVGKNLKRLGAAATNAFYSKGVSDYFTGDNSAQPQHAHSNYQNKLSDFKAAYKKATNGSSPAFNDWQSLAAGFASGEYGLVGK